MRTISAYYTLIFTLLLTLTSFQCFSEEKLIVNSVALFKIHGPISVATLNYLQEGIKEHSDVDLYLIEMNTPGGLVSSTKEILTLMGQSRIPFVVWVGPSGASATSAGAIIASGAHSIFMSEGSNIGAATPIELSGDIKSKDLKSKAINDLVALVSSLSDQHGRNAKGFSEMVEKASSFTAKQALKEKLINGIANNKFDLFSKLNGTTVKISSELNEGKKTIVLNPQLVDVKEVAVRLYQKLLNLLGNPSLAYILFIIGAVLIYFELQAPGGFLAGSAGAVLLLFSALGFQVLPINIVGMLLIALSFILFLLEIFITSYGLLSLLALTSLVSGTMIFYKTDDAYLAFSLPFLLSVSVGIALFIIFILFFWIRDSKKFRQKKRLPTFSLKDHEGTVVEVTSENEYMVYVNGERWMAHSEEKLELNDPVIVIEKIPERMILNVKKIFPNT